MKTHFKTAEGTHDKVVSYTFPQVYDIKNDPSESYELWGNEGYAHTWIMEPVSKILRELQASMAKSLMGINKANSSKHPDAGALIVIK